jgi:hypothetical protein
MRGTIYALILTLVVVSGFVFANLGSKNEASKELTPRPLSATEKNDARKKWEATPDGINFIKWEASLEGKKVYASEAKIRKNLTGFTPMEAVVTSLSLPPGSRLGFGMMVNINGEDYILSFGPEKLNQSLEGTNDFQELRRLKVNDKIMIKSHSVSHAPKYAFPIMSGDYVEQDGKVIYERVLSNSGC